jgi:hypothetical protein
MQSCSAPTNEAIVALSRLLNQKLHPKVASRELQAQQQTRSLLVFWYSTMDLVLGILRRCLISGGQRLPHRRVCTKTHSSWSAPNCGQKEYAAEFYSIFHSTDKK